MKYQRLKSIDGSGTIMRYYPLAEDEIAYANAFYGITSNAASKIEGTVGEGVELIGFSHGGNRLARGLIFLDINPSIEYMAILGEGEDRPNIGDVVNGYQKVVDTHYDGDEGVDGKNDDGFGVEELDAPYYIFTIVQPAGTSYATEIDDSDAGEAQKYYAVPVVEPDPETPADDNNRVNSGGSPNTLGYTTGYVSPGGWGSYGYTAKALFVDENDTELHEPVTQHLNTKRSNYTFIALEIDGYTPDEASKTATYTSNTVKFVYTQNT